MKLRLHIGIHKTGSSYIQYICSNKREELLSNGIWFPVSSEDFKMKRGEISAGNALDLCMHLRKGNEHDVEKYLKNILLESEAKGAKDVLLSSEGLGHDLSVYKKLKLLETTANKVGFESVSVIAYFRDLVDHCISLYKHRSKSGKNPDFEYWVKNIYETPKLLSDFFHIHDEVKFDWTLIKFQKKSDYLVDTFFKQWLGISLIDIPNKPSVNESPTLSEIKLMQLTSSNYSLVTDFFLQKLMNLSREEKAKDIQLEELFRYKANVILREKYLEDLNSWNQYLNDHGRFDFERIDLPESLDLHFTYSSAQLNALVSSFESLSSWRGRLFILRRKIIKLFPTKIIQLLKRGFLK
jgi:hypothetical protein